jgi:hypothetical protein
MTIERRLIFKNLAIADIKKMLADRKNIVPERFDRFMHGVKYFWDN